jgi:hypothetical protein
MQPTDNAKIPLDMCYYIARKIVQLSIKTVTVKDGQISKKIHGTTIGSKGSRRF